MIWVKRRRSLFRSLLLSVSRSAYSALRSSSFPTTFWGLGFFSLLCNIQFLPHSLSTIQWQWCTMISSISTSSTSTSNNSSSSSSLSTSRRVRSSTADRRRRRIRRRWCGKAPPRRRTSPPSFTIPAPEGPRLLITMVRFRFLFLQLLLILVITTVDERRGFNWTWTRVRCCCDFLYWWINPVIWWCWVCVRESFQRGREFLEK